MCVGSIDLVWDGKVHEKWEKSHILGTFRGLLPVELEVLPVELRFWSFLAKSYR